MLTLQFCEVYELHVVFDLEYLGDCFDVLP